MALLVGGEAAAGAPATLTAQLAASTPTARATSILFVGNSFTEGAYSAVRDWRADSVVDLNGDGHGGVPALFKAFTRQVGLNYEVSLETRGGSTLGFHYDERRVLLDRRWDVVVLQEYSTLNRDRPGDPSDYVRDVGRLGRLFAARNPLVRIELMATWSRADIVYRGAGRWSGKPIATMAADLQRAAERARAANPKVTAVIPVGTTWTLAMDRGVADPNPYDGLTFGQVDLWSHDHYHASIAGYYLEALVVFGSVTGIDPSRLGRDEQAGASLGLAPDLVERLQAIASQRLRRAPSMSG